MRLYNICIHDVHHIIFLQDHVIVEIRQISLKVMLWTSIFDDLRRIAVESVSLPHLFTYARSIILLHNFIECHWNVCCLTFHYEVCLIRSYRSWCRPLIDIITLSFKFVTSLSSSQRDNGHSIILFLRLLARHYVCWWISAIIIGVTFVNSAKIKC